MADAQGPTGAEEVVETRIDPMRVAAMHATLGREGAAPVAGDPLPPFWHWSQFWVAEPAERLGRDGHPARGGLIPETGLPRRMWAGGDLRFLAPVVVGEEARRVSRATAPVFKNGRSGRLAFLSIEHEVSQAGRICLHERQDLVFREDPGQGAAAAAPIAPTRAPGGAEHRLEFAPDETELFRYSALTFNGHRIHYDRQYATAVEGYPGLVVHGPLLAQRLIDLAAERLGGLSRFNFRALAPICLPQRFAACCRPDGDALALWIEREDGALAMEARGR